MRWARADALPLPFGLLIMLVSESSITVPLQPPMQRIECAETSLLCPTIRVNEIIDVLKVKARRG